MTDALEDIQADRPTLGPAEFRNARYVRLDNSVIDMELDHPKHGWIPISITQQDYPEVWAEVVATDVAPFVAPDDATLRAQWRPTAKLWRGEFCKALEKLGILPLEEAVSAAKGDWPASFNPLLSQVEDPADALITWATAQQIERLHPLFEAVRQFHQMTPEESDAMFGFVMPALD